MSVDVKVWCKDQLQLPTSDGMITLHQRQITVLFRLQPDKPAVEGLIDTGAPLTIFPQSLWGMFARDIEWLTSDRDESLPDWLRFISGLAGGAIPCRIGRVSVALADDVQSGVPVIAKMAFDGHRLQRRILVGLYGWPMDQGFHWSGSATPRAWLGDTNVVS